MTTGMALALVLKPILLLAFFVVLVAPLKWLFVRTWPEGPLKQRLLRRIN
jgi:hypothetical protein